VWWCVKCGYCHWCHPDFEPPGSVETPKRDVDLIKRRYADAQELAREYEKTKIN
jgi:hypothetical protein